MNKNNKSLSILVLSTIVAGLVISWANANVFKFTWWKDKEEMAKLFQKSQSWETLTQEEQDLLNKIKNNFGWIELESHFKKWINGNMKWLTDDEKIALESMSTEEKTAFYAKKRAERKSEMEAKKAEREAHEAVIDKLLNWDKLTTDEQAILEQIKTKRAERKALSVENEAKMQEMKAIMTKKMNWETLTEEETEKLEKLWGIKNGWMWMMWRIRGWELLNHK